MRKRVTLKKKKSRLAYLYLLPWIIGFLLFFAYPFFKTVYLSLCSVDKVTLAETFIKFDNYKYAFLEDVNFPKMLLQSVVTNLQNIPLILIFSYFVALLLKKKFKGSFLVKTIFFLTVILASDLYLRMQSDTSSLNNAQLQGALNDGGQLFQTFNIKAIEASLLSSGLPSGMITFISGVIGNVSQIMLYSGIQIFIFLAGLHAIPTSLYEAANIDGATPWENFWKITLPMTTPVIIVNLVYTAVDSFSSRFSNLMQYINDIAFKNYNFGYSNALSVVYFLIIGVLLAGIFLFMRKRVFYQV